MPVILQNKLCNMEHRHECPHGSASATCDRAKGHLGKCRAWCEICLVDLLEALVVPVPAVVLRDVEAARRYYDEREAALAKFVRDRLAEAERHYREGNYTEVPATLPKEDPR